MPERPAGPDPPSASGTPWTSADVELWLVTAFRAMPYTAVFAPRGHTLKAVDPNTPDATFDIVAFTGTVLGATSRERQVLLLWARAKASRGEIGGSVSAYCDARGWKRRTFDRIRTRAACRVARAKNEADQRPG